jgi:hypothetical protein
MMKTQIELQDQKSRNYELKRAFDVLKTDYEMMFKSHQREIGALKEQVNKFSCMYCSNSSM